LQTVRGGGHGSDLLILGDLVEPFWQLRIPTYPAGRSDNIRSVIPDYPAT
jgi:hypothetical protein